MSIGFQGPSQCLGTFLVILRGPCGIVVKQRDGRPRNCGGPSRGKRFFTDQPCGKMGIGCFLGDNTAGARLRMSVGIPSLPHTPSWRVQGLIYVYVCLSFYRHKDPLFLDKKLSKTKTDVCVFVILRLFNC